MKKTKDRLTAIFGLVIILAVIGFLSITNFLAGDISDSFLWGLIIGVLPGIASWLYLYSTWDPVKLQPKGENTTTLNPRWISFVVAAGLVFSRGTDLLPPVINQLILGFFVSWLFLGLGYMVVQAWRHR